VEIGAYVEALHAPSRRVPHHREALVVRRDPLLTGEALAVSRGRLVADARALLLEDLVPEPSGELDIGRGPRSEGQRHRHRAHLRCAIGELGSTVLVLVEEAELRPEEHRRGKLGLQPALERDVGAPRWDVDRAAIVGGDDGVPVAPEELRGQLHRHRPGALDTTEPDAQGREGVAEHVGLGGRHVERARAHVDHPAQRRRPVEDRAPTGDDLHRADRQPGDRLPVDPTSEGVVEREPVDEHQGSRDGRGSDAAQVQTLARGVRHPAGGAAKGADVGDLPEHVVEEG
jgi:hypothetical protein